MTNGNSKTTITLRKRDMKEQDSVCGRRTESNVQGIKGAGKNKAVEEVIIQIKALCQQRTATAKESADHSAQT